MDIGSLRWDGVSAAGVGGARPFNSPSQSFGQVGQMEVVHLIHYTESDADKPFLFLMSRRECRDSFLPPAIVTSQR